MDKETLKKLWENKRTHSLIVLIIWIISLGLLMGVVTLINELSPKEKREIPKLEEKQKSLNEKWENLLSQDYSFLYTIIKGEEVVKYEGSVVDGITSGYRERKDGIIRYYIEDDISYEVLMGEERKTDTLYENINANYINIKYIYELTKDAYDEKVLNNKEEKYTYKIKEENEEINISFKTDEKQIKEITIEKENEKYLLKFN